MVQTFRRRKRTLLLILVSLFLSLLTIAVFIKEREGLLELSNLFFRKLISHCGCGRMKITVRSCGVVWCGVATMLFALDLCGSL